MIRVLTKPACGACIQTKNWLDRNSIAYTETTITPELAEWARENGHWQAPIVVFGEESFSGYSPTELEKLKNRITEG
ncbi:hypothetical protein HMPREF3166_01500 [Corynebacterium sp. HMSC08A12]|uniref:glutaredoxin family protein n=1 Tax=Corynebacterium sp. HMSC08A12 TaxID=1581134 RepID=UPI0008A5E76E|nr:glutaredoxin family protein [Corynebacterium sp. HMSC08A12]OFT36224.1 hypothetical protein HMPREF3166_01500 [Corynebacterium sp. HMSC08A12]